VKGLTPICIYDRRPTFRVVIEAFDLRTEVEEALRPKEEAIARPAMAAYQAKSPVETRMRGSGPKAEMATASFWVTKGSGTYATIRRTP